MICYKDRTFCGSPCLNLACSRKFTSADRESAANWWGGDDAPVAFSDMAPSCPDHVLEEPK